MVNVGQLESIITKYYLNGLTDAVKIGVKSKVLTIDFKSVDPSLVGKISTDIDLEDLEIGIYNTKQLLNLLKVLNGEVEYKVEKTGKVATKLKLFDSRFNVEYILADMFLIPKSPKITEPTWNYTFDINDVFIDTFIKANKAIDKDEIGVEINDKNIKFIFGGFQNFSNKLEIYSEYQTLNKATLSKMEFKTSNLKEIFVNNKDMKTGKFYMSDSIIKLEFENEYNIKSTYFLVSNSLES